MNHKPVLLLIEDKPDASFREKVEQHIDLNVRDVAPPTVLLDLQPLAVSFAKLRETARTVSYVGTHSPAEKRKKALFLL